MYLLSKIIYFTLRYFFIFQYFVYDFYDLYIKRSKSRKEAKQREQEFIDKQCHGLFYRFLFPEKGWQRKYRFLQRSQQAVQKLNSLHRSLFSRHIKKNLCFEWEEEQNEEKATRGLFFITFHTDTTFERVIDIMDLFDLSEIGIIVSRYRDKQNVLNDFIKMFQVYPVEGEENTYCSKIAVGKTFHILFIEDKRELISGISRLIRKGVALLTAYDLFQRSQKSSYCFYVKNRPILFPSNFLAKITSKFSLPVVCFYSHRDRFGKDLLILRRITVQNGSSDFEKTLYDELYAFMIKQGMRFKTSWNGYRLLGSNLFWVWEHSIEKERASLLADPQMFFLSEETYLVRFPWSFKEKGGVLIHPYPFSCIKLGPKTFSLMHKRSFSSNKLSQPLMAELIHKGVILKKEQFSYSSCTEN